MDQLYYLTFFVFGGIGAALAFWGW